MKYLCFVIAMMVFSAGAFAQGDTLVVKLKSGTVEKIAVSNIKTIKFENVTSVDENNNFSNDAKNFPNPFSEGTTIEFEIETSGNVEVIIYDNNGNQLRTLNCENCHAGRNQLNWDTKNQKGETVPSGVYYYEIRTNKKTFAKQMLKVR